MRLIIRILACIALIISVGWLYYERDFEPALSMVISLSALISTFLIKKETDAHIQQTQKVDDKSTAIQAGGNVSIFLNQQD